MPTPLEDHGPFPETSMPPMEESIWTSGEAGIIGFAVIGTALIWLAARALANLFGKQSPWRDGR